MGSPSMAHRLHVAVYDPAGRRVNLLSASYVRSPHGILRACATMLRPQLQQHSLRPGSG
jgi:hypothetical protein